MIKFLQLILLVSCTSTITGNKPEIEDLPQCSPIFRYETLDNKEYISLEKSYCLCGRYRFTQNYVGPVGDSWIENIKSCHKVIGWKPKEYGEVSGFWQEVRIEIEAYGNL